MRKSFFIAAMAGAALAATGVAAQTYDPVPPGYGYRPLYQGRSAYRGDERYDHSGTRGRMDLGASPYHPEGPGNPRTR